MNLVCKCDNASVKDVVNSATFFPLQTEGLSKTSNAGSAISKEFEDMLLVCHYYANRAACLQQDSLVRLFVHIQFSFCSIIKFD